MMSEAVTIAIIAASFPTLSVIITAYFNYRSNQKSSGKLDEIHELTNSSATKAQDKIASLEKTIQSLIKEKQ